MRFYPYITGSGFVILTVLFVCLLIIDLRRAIHLTGWVDSKRKSTFRWLIIILIAWVVFVSAWSLSGVMGDFKRFPLNVAPVLFIPLISIIYFVFFSKMFRELSPHLPQEKLVLLQVFRLFVEILLWMLFIENLLPVQLTFEGRNFDILSGVTGLLIAYLSVVKKLPTIVLWIWNIACMGLLINIVTCAILSMPSPIRLFMNEPANTIVTQFPVSWLPGFLVPLAYTLHFMSMRKLYLESKK